MRPRTRAAPATPPCTSGTDGGSLSQITSLQSSSVGSSASTTMGGRRRNSSRTVSPVPQRSARVQVGEPHGAPRGRLSRQTSVKRDPASMYSSEHGVAAHHKGEREPGVEARRGTSASSSASGVGVKASFSANTSHPVHPGEVADPVKVRRLPLRQWWRPHR
jgi:hypothetical protein